ncbi:hypothetical protein T440DRAFT_523403 [Plenodomus tracheiphilus IPT5]|uniref:Uncharacterized protein n=1 Tax=Plenodomus tracheiphilus IPT5 TaxID=1408161 RepID=A0A6A7AMX0_9PLEO|nr:hypothetical protein T440DRAFT_523403 [Plenodomus tracheiphilus IPT5]
MSSTSLYRPSSSCNWADDDDDDFDFDTWKANADASAPTPAELGPLQCAASEDDQPVAFTTENAPFAEVKTMNADNIASSVGTAPDASATIANEIQLAQNAVVCRALADDSNAPAYPGMSYYECWTPSPDKRKGYTSHWNHFKAEYGFDGRCPHLFRSSRLREVISIDEIEDVPELCFEDIEALEEFSEIDVQDMPLTAYSSSSTTDTWGCSDTDADSDSDKENLRPVIRLPTKPISFGEIIDGITTEGIEDEVEFAFEDVFENAQAPVVQDEGYHSSTPPDSPTEDSFGKALEFTTVPDAHQAIAYTHHNCSDRHDSMEVPVAFRNEFAGGDTAFDVFEDDERPLDYSEEAGVQGPGLLDFATWPLPSALSDDDDGNNHIVESTFQKAYDAYLSQSEPPEFATPESEIGIDNDGPPEATDLILTTETPPSTIPEPVTCSPNNTKGEISIVKNEPLEATDLVSSSASPPPSSPPASASSSLVSFSKASTLLKRFFSTAFAKGQYFVSSFPGFGTFARTARDILERMRARLHQC